MSNNPPEVLKIDKATLELQLDILMTMIGHAETDLSGLENMVSAILHSLDVHGAVTLIEV